MVTSYISLDGKNISLSIPQQHLWITSCTPIIGFFHSGLRYAMQFILHCDLYSTSVQAAAGAIFVFTALQSTLPLFHLSCDLLLVD